MKVLYVHHCGERGGASKSLRILITHLIAAGVEPHVLCPDGPVLDDFLQCGIRAEVGINTPQLISSSGGPLRGRRLIPLAASLCTAINVPRFRRRVREIAPDVVHLNERSLLGAAAIAKGEGIPVVMHARNVACQEVGWAQSISESMMRKYADVVVAIDESVQASLPSVQNSVVIYNPLECEVTKASVEADASGRKQLLFLSNLMEQKGVWDLLEAVRRIEARDDFHLWLVGGNSRPPEFFRTLKGKAAERLGLVRRMDRLIEAHLDRTGLRKRVSMTGFVSDIDSVIGGAYLNIFPSHLNGPSRSVYEAGMRGVPSIVALRTSAGDVIEDGVNGVVVKERDPIALASAIERLLDDPQLRNRLGNSAQSQFANQFAASNIATQVLRIYDSLFD